MENFEIGAASREFSQETRTPEQRKQNLVDLANFAEQTYLERKTAEKAE